MPSATDVACGVAISSKLASEFLKKKEEYFLEKYALANNTAQDFRKMYQRRLEDNIIDQGEYKIFVDLYNQYNMSSNENKSFHDTKKRSCLV